MRVVNIKELYEKTIPLEAPLRSDRRKFYNKIWFEVQKEHKLCVHHSKRKVFKNSIQCRSCLTSGMEYYYERKKARVMREYGSI